MIRLVLSWVLLVLAGWLLDAADWMIPQCLDIGPLPELDATIVTTPMTPGMQVYAPVRYHGRAKPKPIIDPWN